MSEPNVSLAFGLCALACVFSIIGSCAPFVDFLPIFSFKIADSPLVLASSLSLSAGVLIFLAISDILPDAAYLFSTSKLVNPSHSKVLALSFVCAGILSVIIVKQLSRRFTCNNHRKASTETLESQEKSSEETLTYIKENHVSHDIFSMLAALSIHNLPEGILIYISTVTQQSLGVLVAIGLVFHKIPEGLVIAMPLYCLTKSKLKAFLISLASPVFLMTGSVIGWAVSNNLYVDNFANGALLAFAVGVLFWVSVAGLLPVSRKLDPQNKVCDISFLVGLAIVMISSSIFSYA